MRAPANMRAPVDVTPCSGPKCILLSSKCAASHRNRTTTLAHHYIEAFEEEKRRQAKRGQVRARASALGRPWLAIMWRPAFVQPALHEARLYSVGFNPPRWGAAGC